MSTEVALDAFCVDCRVHAQWTFYTIMRNKTTRRW